MMILIASLEPWLNIDHETAFGNIRSGVACDPHGGGEGAGPVEANIDAA
jgi:hypothetical protein